MGEYQPMYIVLAVFLFLHGFAHLPGFIVSWRLADLKGMPYKTTILTNSVDIGEIGIRVVGALWLIAALMFIASGIGLLAHAPWAKPVTMASAGFSLALCVVGLPDSRIGLFVNIVVIAFLLIAGRVGWLA